MKVKVRLSAERRRGELGRAEPAHQQHVGRLDQLLREIGEDQRPGERERRAQARRARRRCASGEMFAAASIEPSLRGAKRRSNPAGRETGLLRSARNDGGSTLAQPRNASRASAMKFVRAIWKLLVGIKDALVLLFMLLFFGAALRRRCRRGRRRSRTACSTSTSTAAWSSSRRAPSWSDVASGSRIEQYRLRDLVAALDKARRTTTASRRSRSTSTASPAAARRRSATSPTRSAGCARRASR